MSVGVPVTEGVKFRPLPSLDINTSLTTAGVNAKIVIPNVTELELLGYKC